MIQSASIKTDPNTGATGYVKFVDMPVNLDGGENSITNRESVKIEIMCLMSGYVAERIFMNDSIDGDTLITLESDIRRLKSLTELAGLKPEDISKYMDEVKNILEDNWNVVNSIACVLAECSELTGELIGKIIWAS